VISSVLSGLKTYPFVRLTEAKARLEAEGVDVIDFGPGEPREPVPEFIRDALHAAIDAEPISGYPSAVGLPELRAACAGWVGRRFGAVVDPDTEVIPTLGSKEAIYELAQVVDGAVAYPTPGYPVYERGALFGGREIVPMPLTPSHGWLPDLDALPWDRLGLLWLNSPGNPTAATAPLAWLEDAAARCREHDVVLASDEAYCELWFGGDPPVSALELADRTTVLVFHTLSKRSSMPGYRSGFMAGDPALIAALKKFRPNVGTAPQAFVQRASIAAWSDDAHVAAVRARYAEKRAAIYDALLAAGLRQAGGDASFFLWMAVPGGDDVAFAESLLDRGIIVAPGSWLGTGGEGHVRVALVPTLEQCRRAAKLLTA
jgi:succinyldiaminopimelate transaminase